MIAGFARTLGGITVAGVLGAGTGACNGSDASLLADCSTKVGAPVKLSVGQSVSLDPDGAGGCFTFPANASTTDSAEYLLVAQSAAEVPLDSSPFILEAAPGPAATQLVAQRMPALPRARSNAAVFDAFLRQVGQTGTVGGVSPARTSSGVAPVRTIGLPPPGDLRSFVVCANETCSQTATRWARAEAVGTHVAIYVDTITPLGGAMGGFTTAGLDSLLQVFDSRLYPLATQTFGSPATTTYDGSVIALMTPVVNSLVSDSACHAAGFIGGFFFAGDIYPGLAQLYNNGEIYYSIVPDPDSTLSCGHPVAQVARLAPPTFMHELQHMINFVQHVLVRHVMPEQGWLDEGLSKYGEELAARTYLPDDTATFHRYLTFADLYDASVYLRDPGDSYLLLVNDDGTLAEIGASWLFVRYLMDHSGGALAGQLVQSPYHGPGNVVARTGAPSFQMLVTNWALANWVSDLPGFTPDPALRYTSWNFRATFDTLHAAYPTYFPVSYPLVPVTSAGNAISLSGWLRAGSGVYARALQGPGAAAFALRFGLNRTTALPAGVVPRLTVVRIH